MRLLFISNLYPPHDIGGYEQICEEMAVYLAGRGHQVHVLTSRFGVEDGPEEKAVEPNPVSVQRVLHLEADMQYYKPQDFFLKRDRREQQNIAAVEKAVSDQRPDLVVIWGMWNLSLQVASLAEALLPGKVAYYLCSYWPEDEDLHRQYWLATENKRLLQAIKKPLSAWVLKKLARENYPPTLSMQHVRCVSYFVRETLVQAGRIPVHAGVLYNGIDPAPFAGPVLQRAPSDGRLRLLYFGSLFTHKGVLTALQALAILKSEGEAGELQLTVLGSGHHSYVRELHDFVREHSLEATVRFLPRVPRDQVPTELKQHDAFLFTSTWDEPLARSVMEAMAAGLLVIGTPVGGQAEMLQDGTNALTFPPGDARALAEQIRRAAHDPHMRRELAGEGQALVFQKFTLEKMSIGFEAWLHSILQP